MDALPEYHTCMRKMLLDDHECEANPMTGQEIEWEHPFTFAGPQINEKWAIVPLCWLVHSGGKMNKEINIWIALNRATPEELKKYSKAIPWFNRREHLNKIYGVPDMDL